MERTCENCGTKNQSSCYECFKSNERINWVPPSNFPFISRADKIRKMSNSEMEVDLVNMFLELFEEGVPSREYICLWLNEMVED